MVRIRMVEEKIVELYPEQEMRCPVHLSIGQEGTAAGACFALEDTDYVFSNHRSHAHYLAKGGALKPMIAEIYLRKTGCCGGRGGSMHLNDTSVGFMGAVPIVSSCIPIAVGTALQSQIRGTSDVSLVFLGDAASEEGVYHESVNFAALKKLPVIFFCENNLYSVYSSLDVRVPVNRDLIKLAEASGVFGKKGDGNNVFEVWKDVKTAVDRARNGGGPTVFEFLTYRWREHCGPNFDNTIGYRTEEEFQSWKDRDPIQQAEKILMESGEIDLKIKNDMIKSISEEIDEAFDYAQKSPFPDESTIMDGVYAD